MHEYAPLAITLVAIFAGILFNKHDKSSLKADQKNGLDELRTEVNRGFERVDKQFDEVNSRLLAIEADLRQFYAITGELKARVELLEKRRQPKIHRSGSASLPRPLHQNM